MTWRVWSSSILVVQSDCVVDMAVRAFDDMNDARHAGKFTVNCTYSDGAAFHNDNFTAQIRINIAGGTSIHPCT